MSKVIQKEATS